LSNRRQAMARLQLPASHGILQIMRDLDCRIARDMFMY
jgi:hypothetical protein